MSHADSKAGLTILEGMRQHGVTTILVAAALAVQGATLMSAQTPVPAGIVNFSRISPTIACGGATEPWAMTALAAEGFKTVINVRLASEPGVADEEAVVTRAGMTYIHVPMDSMAPTVASANHFLEVIADPSIQPVYIHCASANRVGALWAIKRVVQDGWTREHAIEEGQAIGLKSQVLLDFVHRFLDGRH